MPTKPYITLCDQQQDWGDVLYRTVETDNWEVVVVAVSSVGLATPVPRRTGDPGAPQVSKRFIYGQVVSALAHAPIFDRRGGQIGFCETRTDRLAARRERKVSADWRCAFRADRRGADVDPLRIGALDVGRHIVSIVADSILAIAANTDRVRKIIEPCTIRRLRRGGQHCTVEPRERRSDITCTRDRRNGDHDVVQIYVLSNPSASSIQPRHVP